MAKISSIGSTRSARLDASSGSYNRRRLRRQNISYTPPQGSSRPPLTPSEVFVHLVRADDGNAAPEIDALCPGANIQVLLKMHLEVNFETHHTTSAMSAAYVLVVHVEAPLSTGGTHTARLDSGNDTASRAPLWLDGIPYTPTSPLRLRRTLGCLYTIISAIEARPARCEGDVWWRFLRFINNVKEAYRIAPPSQITNSLGSSARPRPRPRPRYAEVSKLVDALASLRLTGDDRQDDREAM